jgi:hypothetical protein
VTDGRTLSLTLLSHTNVGKTTLARTLLRRDIGEVLDQVHVTDESVRHTLVETPRGEELVLWDTPGFGDSVRLLNTLRSHDDPLEWIERQDFNRHSDRALWCDQQAVRGVRTRSDVVLYLVNAAEYPEDAGYVDAELEILSWIERPVLLLLNQTGPPRQDELTDDTERWRNHVRRWEIVRGVLPLDAFTRCWVQEGKLLEEVRALVEPERRELVTACLDAWRSERLATFRESMSLLAGELARCARDTEPIIDGAWGNDKTQAQKALANRLRKGTAEVIDRLISVNGLEGRAEIDLRTALADYATRAEKLAPKRWGIAGGVATGLLTGLGADLGTGGLSMGGGMILGAIAGGFGAAGIAKAYNTVRGPDQGQVGWSPEVLTRTADHFLLRYLAVAHFGRGRGAWREREVPGFWRQAVSEAVASREVYFRGAWKAGRADSDTSPKDLQSRLVPLLTGCIREILSGLYPDAGHLL